LGIIGNTAPATVNPDNKQELLLKEAVIGVAEVSYVTYYDLYYIIGVNVKEVLIIAFQTLGMKASDTASLSMEFGASGASLGYREVTLVVKDYCSDVVIPNASVTVTGGSGFSFSGQTDDTGKVVIGRMQVGTYNLVARASGYQGSDEDILKNDSFEVTAEEV
jgi:hypothetical protein